jgi:hypothetical protein
MVSVHGFVAAAQHAVGGRDELQCGEDVFPSSHARCTVEILQLPFFLANLVLWLILASMVFEITLSIVLVCTQFGTLVLSVG